MPSDHEARLLSGPDITPAVVEAWRDLGARAAEPNPCNEPDFVLPAMRHLPDGHRVKLLVAMAGDQMDACLPVLPVARWRKKVPLPALAAWNHPYQLLGSPLVDRTRPVEALTALLRLRGMKRAPALFLSIEDMGDGGPVAAALTEAAAAVRGRVLRWESWERATLTRADAAPPAAGRHKRVRRQRRALEREAGPATVVDRAQQEGVVERFMALEASGWKGRAGTALTSRPGDAAFFREVCERFTRAGRLEMRCLEVASGPVAMQTALRAGDGIFHFKVAFDETYGDYSPGVQLLVDFADGFPEETIGFRDSCTAASNVTESQVWPGRRALSTAVVPFASPTGRTAVRALSAARGRGRNKDEHGPGAEEPAGGSVRDS